MLLSRRCGSAPSLLRSSSSSSSSSPCPLPSLVCSTSSRCNRSSRHGTSLAIGSGSLALKLAGRRLVHRNCASPVGSVNSNSTNSSNCSYSDNVDDRRIAMEGNNLHSVHFTVRAQLFARSLIAILTVASASLFASPAFAARSRWEGKAVAGV